MEVKITRVDTPGWYQHFLFLGPVVNFTETLYLEAVYGLGIDSGGFLIHEIDANFNWETDTTATSLGLKADYRFSPIFRARAGFTVSKADTFGYSLIAGVDFFFRPTVALKYTFQYLSDTVEYLTSPQPHSGIANALTLDLRF